MAKQLEIFSVEKEQKLPKRKMGTLGDNMREFVRPKEARKCAKCGQMIPGGSLAVKLAPLKKGKPVAEEIKYFHPEGRCPEFPVEDEPSL